MGAGETHIGRMRLVGVALCFLAALFFVEAKTAWASGDQFTPTEIASAKACDANKAQVVSIDGAYQAMQIRHAAHAASPGLCQKIQWLDVHVSYASQTKPVSRGIIHGEVPISLTNRPPPFNS